MHIRARHYATGHLIDLYCRNGLIEAVKPASESPAEICAGWVAPALFDLQINGSCGFSFNSPHLTADQVRQVVHICREHGIGGFCPTLITNSFAALLHGLETLRQAGEQEGAIARALPGFHLEGPYISPEDGPRGAHPLTHVRPPDWDEFRRFQEAAGGHIRLVTLAPEHDGALPFIERLVASGVVVALGHTAASGQRIREAVAAGARLSTHLGNGCHALLPRHENYLWEQLAEDGLWASLICDGHHLPAPLVRCFVRIKTPARLILTCDAGSLASMPPGRYRDWDQELEVLPLGKIVVPGTPFLAGSGVYTDRCLSVILRWTGVSLAEALDMAGARPRALLGFPPRRLEVGQPADLVLFEWEEGGEFRLVRTIVPELCGTP